MKRFYYTFFFLGFISNVFAQEGLGYYFDAYNHFYVFDKGNNLQLEENHVDSIKVGNDYLSYIDAKANLKVYYNGESETIEEAIPGVMIPTANALVYKMQQRLMIYEKGKKTELASAVGRFFAGDSIVVWQTYPGRDIMVYENGEIKTVETAISSRVISGGKTGNNLLAYNDLNHNFYIYYNGMDYDTKVSNIKNYKCGKDVVAFTDDFNSTFNVFYKGEIKTVSNQLPQNFWVCDDIVVYLDANGNFMVIYNGEPLKVESNEPEWYKAINNLLVFYYSPELKVFYGGQTYLLEKFIQQKNVVYGINSVLYLDNNNRAKYFYKGKIFENFLIEVPIKMSLNRDLPVFRYGNSSIGFYYKGKLYEYTTSPF